MSLSIDNSINTSIIQSLNDSESVVTKDPVTNTIEPTTESTIEEEEVTATSTITLVTTTRTEQVQITDAATAEIPAETYAGSEIVTTDTFIPDITESIESIQPTVTIITLIQESKTTESSMISSISSDSNSAHDTATDNSNASSDDAKMSGTRIAVITMIIVGVIALITLIMLCIIMKIKKRRHHFNKRISPMYIYHNEKDMSSAINSRKSLNHTIRSVSKKSIFKDDASFYVDSTTDYQINNNNDDDNLSIVIDKPEKLYCNDSNNLSNAMIPNTTSLFPPVHRSNQIYTPSTITLDIEELTDSRESSQTMGGGRRSDRYRPSLRNSILLTGQTSQCSSYQHLRQVSSLYSNKQHKMTLWDDDILVPDAWSTEDKQLVVASTPKEDGRL